MSAAPERQSSKFSGKHFPPSWHCVFLYTRGETSPLFVRNVLIHQFKLNAEDTKPLVRSVYDFGYAAVGEFTAEVAEHKALVVGYLSRINGERLFATIDAL